MCYNSKKEEVQRMNIKDKTNRITLRLNDKQFNFVKASADVLGVSPSEFLRMVINSTMVMTDGKVQKNIGGLGRENDKTNSND
jgi:predicted DNA binding CopG/RHH family protein